MPSLEQRIAENGGLIIAVFSLLFVAGLAADYALLRRYRDRAFDLAGSLFRVTWRPWDWFDPVLVALLTLTVGMCAAKAGPLVERCAGTWADLASLVLQSLAVHGTILAGIEILRRTRGLAVPSAFGCSPNRLLRDLRAGGVCFLALIPPLLALALVNARLLEVFGIDPKMQPLLTQYADADSSGLRVYIGVWAILIAPLAEEALFRGLALPALLKYFAPATAIVMVSAIFATLHFHPPAFLPLFGLSAAMCLAYLVTESLTVPIVMHALFNGTTTTLVLLAS